ncbi:MAG TPA: hypothetical protein VFL86_27345, partial [Burkholderiaceae bacterium]|nr:hypothetical protein [Burkholderiaceae bacterium]
MVGIVSGSTLGLFNTSLFTLGARGNIGSAGLGAGGEAVRLNVATGNLVLQHGDDLLAAQGLDFSLLRTYNSQGQWDDDNGDNWRMGPARRVRDGGAAGRNQAGALAWRVAEDGSESAFTYDAATGLYRGTDGDGAYDTLAWDAGSGRWTFTDGDTRATEVYAGDAEGGVLLSYTDSNGLATQYSYVAGRLAQVVDASGQVTSFVYAGANLVEVRVARGDLSATPVSTVRYEYDAQNRLQRVVTDLTPADGSISDGNTYWVRYGYDGSSTRVNLVEQKDGSRLAIGYVQTDSGAQGWRVSSLTDALDRVTRFAYDTVARTATVTDPLGLQTVYSYDAQARLTGILEPAVGGSTALTTLGYDADGNLLSVQNPLGRRLSLAYDSQGRLVQQQDAAGNTLRRTYDAAGLLATETVFAVADPDGAGPAAPTTPLTRRYVYDAQRNLRFEISPEGRVTEHRYDAQGQRSASLQYTVSLYPVVSLATEAVPTLAQLQAWAAQANPTQRQLTEYRYDARGLLQQMARYATLAADGSGVLDAQALVTTYVHDSYGRLLQSLTNGQAQSFTYDGLNRVLVSTDALGRQVSVSQYDDANRRSTTTLLGGLVRTSVFNAAGELTLVTEGSAAAADLGTTRFFYDAAGRLRMSLSPAGQASHRVYDERGRKVADIDADGYVTRYVFDDAGQLVQTVRHATPVDRARLVAANGEPAPLTLAGLNLASAPDDRYQWALYDTAGRLVRTVDAEGAITDYAYDGASRQVAVTLYATPLANLAALRSGGATLANTNPPSLNPAADRVTRSIYSRDGLLLNQLDAEGRLSENNYDAAGRLVRARRFANAPAFFDLQTGTVRPGRATGNDIATVYQYDAAGRLVATRDAEGYITVQSYDRSGNLATRTRYATPTSGFTPSPAPTEDQTWTYRYNALNQLESETDPDGTVTTHQYDDAGRLIASERGWQTVDARRQRQRYDVQGRLVQELAPEHAALLSAASTPQEIDAVFAAYATSYTYDRDGHRIAVRNAKGQTSLLYYDTQGRLAYTVSAVGEVQRLRYNAFDELESSTRFAQHLGDAARTGLSGGATTAALRDLFDRLGNPARDAVTVTHYSAAGRVASVQDAEGILAISQYNSFGELSLTRQQISQQTDSAGTRWQERSYAYDRRGLLTTTTADPGGRALVTVNEYDAFGRVQAYTDENRQVHRTAYDKLGRVVETQDPLTPARLTTYDAFGRVLTQRDPLGHVTAYEYHLAERSLTIRSAAGTADEVTTRITYNRHGQQYQVTDGRGATTTYEYDSAGRVTRVSDAQGTLQTQSYDPLLGTVHETTDANGVVTRYSYDAVQRVQLRVVDPAGVAATTSYVYGESERTLRETGPDGVVTLTRYDRRGQAASVTVDPDHLALVTAYEYDGAGRSLAVTDPNGHRRIYAYDSLGRRISETVDPGQLNLTTLYAYDDRGNLTQRTDPRGNATRYAYDAAGRLVFTIDALGGVSELRYDDNGQVVARIAYAQPITTACGLAPALADVRAAVLAVADAAHDRVAQSFYDAQGRERFTLDSSGALTEQRFDRNGNVERRINYATAWTGAVPAGTQALADALRDRGLADPAHDRLEIQFFDARNRVTHRVDGAGGVTVFGYDAAGHVVESLACATAIANPQGLTDLASLTSQLVTDPAHDTHSRHVYDSAGRLVATATAQQQQDAQGQVLWAVQQIGLDDAGRVTTSTRRAAFLAGGSLPAVPSQEQVRAWVASVAATPGQDSVQRFVYDAAGRLAYSIDATGAVTRSVYDNAGNLVQRVSYAQPVVLAGVVSKPKQVEDALGAALADPANRGTLAVFDAADRQRLAIDALGHVTSYTLDARGNVLATTRHALAADTRAWTLDRGYEALAQDADFTQWQAASAGTGQDRTERNVYDALDRSTHSVDALGYVKRRDYDALGRLVAGVAFAQNLGPQVAMEAGAIDTALGATPQGALPASARVERFEYDSRGLLVRSTDAEGRSERFTYDGVGNKREFFNKAGALWTYDYDAAGRLRAEKTPQVEVASVTQDAQGSLGVTLGQAQIETRMVYDALGRLTTRTEAFGLPEARTTTYGYDAAGRQVRVTYPAVAVYTQESQQALLTNGFGSAAVRVEQTRTLSTLTRYDALGRAVVDQDLGGNFRYRSYDAAGQLAYEVDAEGAVTGYRRNAFGEVETLTRFAQVIGDLPARAGQPYTQADLDGVYRPSGKALAGRTLQFVYDQAGRQTHTIEPEVLVYDPTRVGAAGAVATAGRTTEQTFNAFGEVTRRSVVGQGGQARLTSTSSVYLYYSRKGEVIGELTQVKTDQAYLTRRFYDAVGNLQDQFEYATALSGSDALWSAAASPDDLGFAARAPEDRHTSWTYDKTNLKLSETRHQALHTRVDSSGGITSLRADLVTRFGYDAVGNQSRVTDALGASTYTYHDALGRITAVVAPAVPFMDTAASGTFIRPVTRLRLDAYGNVVEQVAYAGGATQVSEAGYTAPSASAQDRRTLSRYDSHGHVVQVLDAAGATSQRSYDEFGRVAKEWRSFTDADGRTVTAFQQYRYDKVGRQVAVLTPASTSTLVPLNGQFTVAVESRSQATVLTEEDANLGTPGSVLWTGTNQVRLGFPQLAPGTALQVELRYRTGEYGTPGAASEAGAVERSQVFEVAKGDGRSALLSWTDSQTDQGLSEVLGFVVRVRDANGRWVTQHDARQELIGLDKAQVVQRSQLAVGVVAETLQYNAFGEVEKKRRNGQVVEQIDYNAAGQVWRTQAGNGVWHGLLHDVDGHVTADIRSADPDRLRVALDETEVAGLRVSQSTTETRYDLMGRVVAQVLPSRSTAAQAGGVATPAMLTWTLKTGNQAQPDNDAYTHYGQGPIYRINRFTSGLALPSRIDLQWSSLAALGSGDVEVQVDYTDTQSSQRTEVQRFRAEDAEGGATVYWTAPAVAAVIHRVRVKKKDAAGEWVTVLDRASQGTYGSRVVFQGPSAVDATVTLRYRLQGGTAYLFAPTDALSGTYEYELWAVNAGQSASTLRDKGSMTLTSTAMAVGNAATLAGETSSVLSWADPGSTQTQVFHYRQQGSRNWQSLAVSTVASGRKGVDLKTLPDGIYEYELLYYAAGQSGTPNAHATGVFTTRAARPAGPALANVDAVA